MDDLNQILIIHRLILPKGAIRMRKRYIIPFISVILLLGVGLSSCKKKAPPRDIV